MTQVADVLDASVQRGSSQGPHTPNGICVSGSKTRPSFDKGVLGFYRVYSIYRIYRVYRVFVGFIGFIGFIGFRVFLRPISSSGSQRHQTP